MRALSVLCLSLWLATGPAGPAGADTVSLPPPDEVFTISIKPHAKQLTDFFTPARLMASLPRFKRAYVTPPIGGKIWTQSGVIVLKNKQVLYWRSYREDVLAIETAVDPIYYVIDDD